MVAADGTEYTYADLAARVARLATALQDLGVEQGDRVAVLSPNTHWCVEAVFTTQHLGGVFTPLNYRLTPDDYRYLLDDCGARVVVADYEYAEKISDLRDEVPAEEFVCYESDRVEGDWLDYDAPERPDIAEDDEAAIYYTSGTTGDPKGVVEPTIFTDVTNDMRVAREEVFGPVLTFADEDEALDITDDSEYGLAAGVWTTDIRRGIRMSRALEDGAVTQTLWSRPATARTWLTQPTNAGSSAVGRDGTTRTSRSGTCTSIPTGGR